MRRSSRGGWRQIALGDRLGVPATLGMSTREWVEERLGGYVRLSLLERREAVLELTEEGMTQRQISDVLGVGKGTVSREQRAPNGAADDEELSIEAEVVEAPAPNGATRKQRLADLPDDLAARVGDGMDLGEAEAVAVEREKRIGAWVADVRRALEVLGRMAGSPVPSEVRQALSAAERKQLRAALSAIERKEPSYA